MFSSTDSIPPSEEIFEYIHVTLYQKFQMFSLLNWHFCEGEIKSINVTVILNIRMCLPINLFLPVRKHFHSIYAWLDVKIIQVVASVYWQFSVRNTLKYSVQIINIYLINNVQPNLTGMLTMPKQLCKIYRYPHMLPIGIWIRKTLKYLVLILIFDLLIDLQIWII